MLTKLNREILEYIRENEGLSSYRIGKTFGLCSNALDQKLTCIENDPDEGRLFSLDEYNRIYIYRNGGSDAEGDQGKGPQGIATRNQEVHRDPG